MSVVRGGTTLQTSERPNLKRLGKECDRVHLQGLLGGPVDCLLPRTQRPGRVSVACEASAGSLFPPAPPWTLQDFAAKFPRYLTPAARGGGGGVRKREGVSHRCPARSTRGGGAERGRRVWGRTVAGHRVTGSSRGGGRTRRAVPQPPAWLALPRPPPADVVPRARVPA